MNLEREFSQKKAPELRKKTADEIRAARAEHRRAKTQAETSEPDTETGQEKAERELELKKMFFQRLLKTEKYLELKDEVVRLTEEHQREKIYLKQKSLEEIERRHTENIAEIRQKFDEGLSQTLANCPLSPEEQQKYLMEENLVNMDLRSYLALMKRLSGNFVSHVTRFGIREQTQGPHKMGAETFMDNFTPILETKRLNGLFSNIINETDYTKSVIRLMIDHETKYTKQNKEEVVQNILESLIRREYDPEHAADASSVHFAANAVMSKFYGAEFGYDIYFYFPAEVIAYNYRIQSQAGRFSESLNKYSRSSADDKRNDLAVWNNGQGIPVEAGILCLPQDLRVDPETGSQYLTINNEAQANPLYQEPLEYLLANRQECTKILNDLSYNQNGKISEETYQETAEKLHFPSVEIFKEYLTQSNRFSGTTDIELFYRSRSDFYLRPSQTISSQEYWEKYFASHPEKKPNKVIYTESYNQRRRPELLSGEKKAEMDKGGFHSTQNLDGYEEYLDEVKKKMESVISQIYDEWEIEQTKKEAQNIFSET